MTINCLGLINLKAILNNVEMIWKWGGGREAKVIGRGMGANFET